MTSPTLDCLNQHRAPRLEDLILAEVFLAGGPCYIHRLWSEMFERQKSISAGRIIFAREVIRMERDGLLQQHEGDRTAITNQGKVHLFGLVLLGMIPDEQKHRLESRGVLGVASQQKEHSTKAVNHGSGTGVVANRKPLDNNNSDTQLLSEKSMTSKKGGVEGEPIEALPFKSLGVAKQVSRNAPLTDGLQVGRNGGGASTFLPSPPVFSGTTILELEDSVIRAEQQAKVEGPDDDEEEGDGGIFGTGDPYEMEHNQHGRGCR